MRFQYRNHIWIVLAITAAACAVSLFFIDRVAADTFREWTRLSFFDVLVSRSAECIPALSALAIIAYAVQWLRGVPAGRWIRMMALAGAAALTAIVVNSIILKPMFGRISTWDYLHHGEYGFNFFSGTMERSGFPSGHIVTVTAFLSVISIKEPRWMPHCVVLVAVQSVMLVLGGWHFVSDALAGVFFGITAGAVATSINSE